MPDDVQPTEGQGTEAAGSPYDSYLQTVPEEAKEAAEQWFRDTSKGLDAKLQEAAELQKSFGQFKDVDLSGYQPEDLSQLIAWHQQITSSDEAFREWLAATAKETGLTPAEQDEVAEAEETGELTREQVEQLVQQMAEQRVGPLQEQLTNIETEKQVDYENQSIGDALQALQSEFKLDLTNEQKAVILDLGLPLAYDEKGSELPLGDSSWVRAGFDRWKEIQSLGAKTFVEEKAQQPGATLTAGGTPALKPITSFQDANAAMRERLRQQS